MQPARLVMFTRYPEPGAAKTRLIPALGEDGAAALHRRLAERTIATLDETGLPVEIRITGAPGERFEAWLGGHRRFVEQGEGDLGARMQRATRPAPVILVGSDCPDLEARHVRHAALALADHPVAIGPAADGGYWLLGLAEPMDFLFGEMPWGTERVFSETMAQLDRQKIEPTVLETLADCDRPEDLDRWPDLVH